MTTPPTAATTAAPDTAGMRQPDPLRQAACLRAAKTELAQLRGRIHEAAAFIHDSDQDLSARCALAQLLGLPTPTTTAPCDTAHATANRTAGAT
ncbi:hypothetical protein ACWC4A_52570 [Streptomyces mirabilis]